MQYLNRLLNACVSQGIFLALRLVYTLFHVLVLVESAVFQQHICRWVVLRICKLCCSLDVSQYTLCTCLCTYKWFGNCNLYIIVYYIILFIYSKQLNCTLSCPGPHTPLQHTRNLLILATHHPMCQPIANHAPTPPYIQAQIRCVRYVPVLMRGSRGGFHV